MAQVVFTSGAAGELFVRLPPGTALVSSLDHPLPVLVNEATRKPIGMLNIPQHMLPATTGGSLNIRVITDTALPPPGHDDGRGGGGGGGGGGGLADGDGGRRGPGPVSPMPRHAGGHAPQPPPPHVMMAVSPPPMAYGMAPPPSHGPAAVSYYPPGMYAAHAHGGPVPMFHPAYPPPLHMHMPLPVGMPMPMPVPMPPPPVVPAGPYGMGVPPTHPLPLPQPPVPSTSAAVDASPPAEGPPGSVDTAPATAEALEPPFASGDAGGTTSAPSGTVGGDGSDLAEQAAASARSRTASADHGAAGSGGPDAPPAGSGGPEAVAAGSASVQNFAQALANMPYEAALAALASAGAVWVPTLPTGATTPNTPKPAPSATTMPTPSPPAAPVPVPASAPAPASTSASTHSTPGAPAPAVAPAPAPAAVAPTPPEDEFAGLRRGFLLASAKLAREARAGGGPSAPTGGGQSGGAASATVAAAPAPAPAAPPPAPPPPPAVSSHEVQVAPLGGDAVRGGPAGRASSVTFVFTITHPRAATAFALFVAVTPPGAVLKPRLQVAASVGDLAPVTAASAVSAVAGRGKWHGPAKAPRGRGGKGAKGVISLDDDDEADDHSAPAAGAGSGSGSRARASPGGLGDRWAGIDSGLFTQRIDCSPATDADVGKGAAGAVGAGAGGGGGAGHDDDDSASRMTVPIGAVPPGQTVLGILVAAVPAAGGAGGEKLVWLGRYGASTATAPPGAPAVPSASKATRATLKVKWAAPADDGGSPVTAFEVQMSEVVVAGGGHSDASEGPALRYNWHTVYTGAERVHELRRLRPGTSLAFRVRATNAAGWGPFSPSCIIRTEAGVPDAPLRVTVAPVDATTAKVTWLPPADAHGAPVLEYVVEQAAGAPHPEYAAYAAAVRAGGAAVPDTAGEGGGGETAAAAAPPHGLDFMLLARTPDTAILAGDLPPLGAVTFRVRAVNAVGMSSPSDLAPVTLAVTHLHPPTHLHLMGGNAWPTYPRAPWERELLISPPHALQVAWTFGGAPGIPPAGAAAPGAGARASDKELPGAAAVAVAAQRQAAAALAGSTEYQVQWCEAIVCPTDALTPGLEALPAAAVAAVLGRGGPPALHAARRLLALPPPAARNSARLPAGTTSIPLAGVERGAIVAVRVQAHAAVAGRAVTSEWTEWLGFKVAAGPPAAPAAADATVAWSGGPPGDVPIPARRGLPPSAAPHSLRFAADVSMPLDGLHGLRVEAVAVQMRVTATTPDWPAGSSHAALVAGLPRYAADASAAADEAVAALAGLHRSNALAALAVAQADDAARGGLVLLHPPPDAAVHARGLQDLLQPTASDDGVDDRVADAPEPAPARGVATPGAAVDVVFPGDLLWYAGHVEATAGEVEAGEAAGGSGVQVVVRIGTTGTLVPIPSVADGAAVRPRLQVGDAVVAALADDAPLLTGPTVRVSDDAVRELVAVPKTAAGAAAWSVAVGGAWLGVVVGVDEAAYAVQRCFAPADAAVQRVPPAWVVPLPSEQLPAFADKVAAWDGSAWLRSKGVSRPAVVASPVAPAASPASSHAPPAAAEPRSRKLPPPAADAAGRSGFGARVARAGAAPTAIPVPVVDAQFLALHASSPTDGAGSGGGGSWVDVLPAAWSVVAGADADGRPTHALQLRLPPLALPSAVYQLRCAVTTALGTSAWSSAVAVELSGSASGDVMRERARWLDTAPLVTWLPTGGQVAAAGVGDKWAARRAAIAHAKGVAADTADDDGVVTAVIVVRSQLGGTARSTSVAAVEARLGLQLHLWLALLDGGGGSTGAAVNAAPLSQVRWPWSRLHADGDRTSDDASEPVLGDYAHVACVEVSAAALPQPVWRDVTAAWRSDEPGADLSQLDACDAFVAQVPLPGAAFSSRSVAGGLMRAGLAFPSAFSHTGPLSPPVAVLALSPSCRPPTLAPTAARLVDADRLWAAWAASAVAGGQEVRTPHQAAALLRRLAMGSYTSPDDEAAAEGAGDHDGTWQPPCVVATWQAGTVHEEAACTRFDVAMRAATGGVAAAAHSLTVHDGPEPRIALEPLPPGEGVDGDPAWQLLATAALSDGVAVTALVPGASLSFRVRARDPWGRVSPWTPPFPAVPLIAPPSLPPQAVHPVVSPIAVAAARVLLAPLNANCIPVATAEEVAVEVQRTELSLVTVPTDVLSSLPTAMGDLLRAVAAPAPQASDAPDAGLPDLDAWVDAAAAWLGRQHGAGARWLALCTSVTREHGATLAATDVFLAAYTAADSGGCVPPAHPAVAAGGMRHSKLHPGAVYAYRARLVTAAGAGAWSSWSWLRLRAQPLPATGGAGGGSGSSKKARALVPPPAAAPPGAAAAADGGGTSSDRPPSDDAQAAPATAVSKPPAPSGTRKAAAAAKAPVAPTAPPLPPPALPPSPTQAPPQEPAAAIDGVGGSRRPRRRGRGEGAALEPPPPPSPTPPVPAETPAPAPVAAPVDESYAVVSKHEAAARLAALRAEERRDRKAARRHPVAVWWDGLPSAAKVAIAAVLLLVTVVLLVWSPQADRPAPVAASAPF